jgi:hypothetical protein
VNFQNVFAAGALVKTVDVLRDYSERRRASFEFGKGGVTGVGLNGGDETATPVVPLPTQLWIAHESFRRGQIFRLELPP